MELLEKQTSIGSRSWIRAERGHQTGADCYSGCRGRVCRIRSGEKKSFNNESKLLSLLKDL